LRAKQAADPAGTLGL